MKRIALSLCTVAVLLFACKDDKTASTSEVETTTGDTATNKNEAWVPVDSATAMNAWMAYATPGDVHKMVASWNGTWTGQMSSWMTEGAPPSVNTTNATNTMILDGRYQQSKHTGSFDGMPFEGVSTMGYDNSKKQFVSS